MTVESTRHEIAAARDSLPQLTSTGRELAEHYETLTRLLEGSSSQNALDGVHHLFQAKAGVERAEGLLRHARQRADDYSAFL